MVEQNEIIIKKEVSGRSELIIDHLILYNFKSYAGIQKIGPFHHVSRSHYIFLKNLYNLIQIEIFLYYWSQWKWEIQYYRCCDVCFWSSCTTVTTSKNI
jgi:hypothetical protein